MPEGAVYVGRPTRWGNPFRAVREGGFQWVEDPTGRRWSALRCSTDRTGTRAEMLGIAVDLYALHTGPMGEYEYGPDDLADLRRDLGGRDLVCWCPPEHPCHGDVLLRLANPGLPTTHTEETTHA